MKTCCIMPMNLRDMEMHIYATRTHCNQPESTYLMVKSLVTIVTVMMSFLCSFMVEQDQAKQLPWQLLLGSVVLRVTGPRLFVLPDLCTPVHRVRHSNKLSHLLLSNCVCCLKFQRHMPFK